MPEEKELSFQERIKQAKPETITKDSDYYKKRYTEIFDYLVDYAKERFEIAAKYWCKNGPFDSFIWIYFNLPDGSFYGPNHKLFVDKTLISHKEHFLSTEETFTYQIELTDFAIELRNKLSDALAKDDINVSGWKYLYDSYSDDSCLPIGKKRLSYIENICAVETDTSKFIDANKSYNLVEKIEKRNHGETISYKQRELFDGRKQLMKNNSYGINYCNHLSIGFKISYREKG